MTNFYNLGLSPILKTALDANKFITPTPIQEKTIPLALEGRDIMGSAQTGTGKTLAFLIPLIEHLIKESDSTGLILAPTRELAQQVVEGARKLLGFKSAIRTALLIGGESYTKQLSQLRSNPRIIVGTPGRIIDHQKRGTLSLRSCSFLVLDETDRMFDMGFGIQIEEIIKKVPSDRQTLMFSATFPKKIERLAEQHMRSPERISVASIQTISPKLKQETRHVKESEKYGVLLDELQKRDGSIIVFVGRKGDADKIADKLCDLDFQAAAIHGDLRQQKRERVMSAFRKGRHRIMIATDVAARGLDVPSIQHVINYDLPHAPEDFIHRIGRTARAGAEGSALSFISGQDKKRWNAIQRVLDPNAVEEKDVQPRGANNNRSGKRKASDVFGDKRPRKSFGHKNPRQDKGHGESKNFKRKEKDWEFGENHSGIDLSDLNTSKPKKFKKPQASASAAKPAPKRSFAKSSKPNKEAGFGGMKRKAKR